MEHYYIVVWVPWLEVTGLNIWIWLQASIHSLMCGLRTTARLWGYYLNEASVFAFDYGFKCCVWTLVLDKSCCPDSQPQISFSSFFFFFFSRVSIEAQMWSREHRVLFWAEAFPLNPQNTEAPPPCFSPRLFDKTPRLIALCSLFWGKESICVLVGLQRASLLVKLSRLRWEEKILASLGTTIRPISFFPQRKTPVCPLC